MQSRRSVIFEDVELRCQLRQTLMFLEEYVLDTGEISLIAELC